MGCTDGISKQIQSTCINQPSAGVEVKAWLGNRLEAGITYDVTNPSKVTDIQMITGKQLFPLVGVKKLLNPGTDLVVAEDRADRYKNKLSFQGFEFTCNDIENIDALNDLIAIVEMRDKIASGDGTFRIFGLKKGLYKTSLAWTANEINGAIAVELANEEGADEAYPWYTLLDTDYATTLALLVSQEIPQP